MFLLMVRSTESSGEIGGNCLDWENGAHVRSKPMEDQGFDNSAVHRTFSSFLHCHDGLFNSLCLSERNSYSLCTVSASGLGYICTNIRHIHTHANLYSYMQPCHCRAAALQLKLLGSDLFGVLRRLLSCCMYFLLPNWPKKLLCFFSSPRFWCLTMDLPNSFLNCNRI